MPWGELTESLDDYHCHSLRQSKQDQVIIPAEGSTVYSIHDPEHHGGQGKEPNHDADDELQFDEREQWKHDAAVSEH